VGEKPEITSKVYLSLFHIHIATVEPQPTTERGMRKQKSLDAMKSKVVNQMMDRGDSQKKKSMI